MVGIIGATFKKLPKNAKLHPTDKTLQWDMMLGKAIVKWAHEQGLRGTKPAITVTFTPRKKRVRPAFERWKAQTSLADAMQAHKSCTG